MLEVNQKIYLEPVGNATRRYGGVLETTISKVGRKYFEVNELPNHRFSVETLKHDGQGFNHQFNGYLTMQEIVDKKDGQKLFDEIKHHFSGHRNRLSLDKLKEIKEILDR